MGRVGMKSSMKLRKRFKKLHQKRKNGTFDDDDMVDLLAICIELRKRGLILSKDESYWVKPMNKSKQ